MQRLNIKEYITKEKDALKTFAQKHKIKLGIIDATKEEDKDKICAQNKIMRDFNDMGWETAVYKVREREKTCGDAIIRAIKHHCNCLMVQLSDQSSVVFKPYDVPRKFDCNGVRPDSWVDSPKPRGILDFLTACEFPFSGKNAVILGKNKNNIEDRAMAHLLLEEGMTISICHDESDPSYVSNLLCDADLVISMMNKPHGFVRTQCLNALVVDTGVNRLDGKVVGDFEEMPHLTSDTAWSVSLADGVELLERTAFLKNCAFLVDEYEK